MPITRRTIGATLAAALLIVGLAPTALAAAEDSFLSKLNGARASRGLPALVSHWDLVDDAEAHSVRMMEADRLHHNPNLGTVTTGWQSLGENVGVGPSVQSIHTAFMNSSAHRANILGDYTHVGIGAVRQSDDKLWVTVVFMKTAGGSPTTTTSAPTTTAVPTTTAAPTTTVPATTTAAPTTTVAATTTTVPTRTAAPTTSAAPTVTPPSTAPSSAAATTAATQPGLAAPTNASLPAPGRAATQAIMAGIISGLAASASSTTA